MISIIHPSHGRPYKSFQTISKWIERAKNEIQVILSLDESDEVEIYMDHYTHLDDDKYDVIVSPNRNAVDAINVGAGIAGGDILMVVSDDTDCPELWDIFLLKWIAGRTDFICKTQDGTQPWIITNPIMDRTYYNRFGYIYHPDYKHMFCDTELTCVADLTGRKITSNILFKHNHYSVTKTEPDAISKRADATWAQGEKLFLERYKRNFDLPPDQIKGRIEDQNMVNWLLRKNRL